MVRPIILTFALAAALGLAPSRPSLASYDKDRNCPRADLVSQSYTTESGEVVAVESGDRIVVETPQGRRTLRLMGIAAPALDQPLGRASRDHLARLLRGRKAELWFISLHSAATEKTRGAAVVRVHHPSRDVGLEQVEKGFAKLEDFGPYSLDSRDDCLYRNAEGRAKAKHRGVWAP